MTLCSVINKFDWGAVKALIKCNFDQAQKAMAKLDTAQVRISSLEKSLAAAEAEQQRAQDNWLDLSSQHEKLRAQLAAQNLEILEKGKEV
jgi:predicted  nucleic acid-binding Zn-ribbon protein